MRKRTFWTAALLALGTALIAHDNAQAQRGGIRIGGGGIGIGGGGIRVGVGTGGWGYGPGVGGWGYGPGIGVGRGGIGIGPGIGVGRYGYAPGYGWGTGYRGGIGIGVGTGFRPSYYSDPYYGSSGYYSSPGYYSAPGYYSVPGYSAGYASPEPMGTLNAEVHVPHPNARVTFNGVASTKTGTTRYFETEYLQHGRNYNFEATATWMEDGREVTQRRMVTGQAGQTVQVHFGRDAGTTDAAPRGDTGRPAADDLERLTTPPGDRPVAPPAVTPPSVTPPVDPLLERDRKDSGTGRPGTPDIGRPVDDAGRDLLRDPARDLIRDPLPKPPIPGPGR